MHAFSNIAYFLITTLFGLFTFTLWMRVFIRYFSISPFFAFSQSIYQMTNPAVTPIQRYMPIIKVPNMRFDVACLLLLTVCVFLKYMVLNALFFNSALSFFSLIAYIIADMLIEPCNIIFYAIIGRVVIGWLSLGRQHPFLGILYAVTEPLLKFFRRKIPPFGLFDLSALFAIISLQVFTIFVRNIVAPPVF